LESPATPERARRQSRLKVQRILTNLTVLANRWSQEHRSAPPLVPPDRIEQLRERLRHV
jgi:hypothetical protein